MHNANFHPGIYWLVNYMPGNFYPRWEGIEPGTILEGIRLASGGIYRVGEPLVKYTVIRCVDYWHYHDNQRKYIIEMKYRRHNNFIRTCWMIGGYVKLVQQVESPPIKGRLFF